jgi:hypothetical protein
LISAKVAIVFYARGEKEKALVDVVILSAIMLLKSFGI